MKLEKAKRREFLFNWKLVTCEISNLACKSQIMSRLFKL